MDSKRKSVFSLPHNRGTKKAKLNDSKCTDGVSCPAKEHLNLLRSLLGDIINNHESSVCGAINVNPEILFAATELDAALHRAKGPTPTSSIKATISKEVPATSEMRELPNIPPIMNSELERAVFTHPGVSSNIKATYDRLEVLGDAYIELISTKLIWDRFQDISSGQISQIRELLVKNETLSEYATRYKLDSRASVPPDYLNQPKRWLKTKADIFEAYVAAVIQSNPTHGYSIAEAWLTQLWSPKLEQLRKPKSSLHAKETLAKRIMGKGIKLNYIEEHPPTQKKGTQTFSIGVYLTGWGWDHKHLGSGQGSNKAIAGDEAAQQALLNEELIEEILKAKRACLERV
ncbi:ribonuclease III [Aspergillus heteromorphus CBS 117.55]|uniref:Ribonuclease III n=1 Tax=Aspergillus heteromorphus CBS 117.55 TaxID=1448321 RepID=A0A317V4N5_9EURO|nr:ribonuclease III [Aspergillus heteromorphus CBS 117.55]PWY68038.1 ribonuclease III [Aspergillus heteromorphus CBS 117.55]